MATFLAFAPAQAQLVTPKTVPVFQDEQFDIYPSSRPGLAGVSIALDDTLGDPFTNPAKTIRARGLVITTAPYSHGISGSRGGGRTLPIGFIGSNGTWAGAFLGAIQQSERVGPVWNLPTNQRTASNQYLTASLAHLVAPGLAVGVSAFHADLAAVDGVDLLYAGSDRIEQSGSLNDFRLGATKEWEQGHVLELLVLRNRTDMRHDVHFTTFVFDTALRRGVTVTRQDANLDQTNIWGVHTEYTRPVGKEGWRVGILGTANVLSHPKIPNYSLQNIPRDPGTTHAFNVGLGAARVDGPFTFGVDVVLEPMTSNTWADAPVSIKRTDGTVIPAGEKTVENHFQFKNTRARIGIGHAWMLDKDSTKTVSLDLGLGMYAISYDLRQTSNITRLTRRQHENWVESGPRLGVRFKSRDFEVSYAFRSVCGNADCNEDTDIVFGARLEASTGGIIAAPSSALFFQSGRESSHHFMITVPMR
jgi:hypothetical protein